MHEELAQILGRFKIDWRVLRAVITNVEYGGRDIWICSVVNTAAWGICSARP